MNSRLIPGWALVVLAVTALAAAVRMTVTERLADGALALGLALALGSCGVMWLLIERRRALVPRAATSASRSPALDQ